MTLTSAESIEVVRELGVQRVVAARELSLEEIRRLRAETPVPLEVFVHGALCVAYSGQCLTSESLGGRSANRGECAQACRLPYDLVCDGQDVDLGKVKYLLSPQDLAAYALVPALIAAGVSALKIEGRLKKPEYVANITRHYRLALDAALAGQPVEFERRTSRGDGAVLFARFLARLARGKRLQTSRARARVPRSAACCWGGSSVSAGGAWSWSWRRPWHPVTGWCLRETEPRARSRAVACWPCIGARIGCRKRSARETWNSCWRGSRWILAVWSVGQQVWKTDDPQLTSRLRRTFSGPDPQRRVPLDLVVQAAVGEPLRVRGRASNGAACELASHEPLAAAIRRPLTADLLREQLGRLGGTVYELRRLEARIEGEPIVPLSVLGRLRREMIELLDAAWRGAAHAARRAAAGAAEAAGRTSAGGAARNRGGDAPGESAQRRQRRRALPAPAVPHPRAVGSRRRLRRGERGGRLPGHPRVSPGGADRAGRRSSRSSWRRRASINRARPASFALCCGTGPTEFWSAISPDCSSAASTRSEPSPIFRSTRPTN